METLTQEEITRRAGVVARREATLALAAAHAAHAVNVARKNAALNAALSGTKGTARTVKRVKLLKAQLPHEGESFTETLTLARIEGGDYVLARTIEGPGRSYRAAGTLKATRDGRVGVNALPATVAADAMSRAAKRRAKVAEAARAAAEGVSGDAAKKDARSAARQKIAGHGLSDTLTLAVTFSSLPVPGSYVVSAAWSDDSGASWLVSGRATLTDWTVGDTDAFMV